MKSQLSPCGQIASAHPSRLQLSLLHSCSSLNAPCDRVCRYMLKSADTCIEYKPKSPVETLGRAMDAEITALLVDDQVRVVCARPSGAT
jgi:hypothetical protein